jgi:signal peptidase II
MLDRRAEAALALTVVLALDQLTKSWASSALWMHPRRIVDGWLHLELHVNRGVAFGHAAGWPAWVLAIPALAVLSWIAWTLRRHPERSVWLSSAVAAAGVLGNVLDRSLRTVPSLGATPGTGVVDFIVVAPGRWPAFNVADVAILAGLLALVAASQRARAAGV